MNKQTVFSYDELSDWLFISCKNLNEKVEGSVRLLNVILDFSTDGRIVGFELKNASLYLEKMGIDPAILKNLTGAGLMVQEQSDGYIITFTLHTPEKTEHLSYNIVRAEPLLTHAF